MTITFVPTETTKEVEVQGFGKVKIRPYGAGEELQISKNLRELEEMQAEAEAFLESVKQKYQNDESKITEKEKKDFEKIQSGVFRLSNELNELIRGTLTSDDPKVAERIFNELPMTEIRKLISTALGKGTDA